MVYVGREQRERESWKSKKSIALPDELMVVDE